MKAVDFFKMLIASAENVFRNTGKTIIYFDKSGKITYDEDGAKWFVKGGSVHDNEEKVSSKAEKYNENLGLLF